jgi:hypothetical protein
MLRRADWGERKKGAEGKMGFDGQQAAAEAVAKPPPPRVSSKRHDRPASTTDFDQLARYRQP